MNFFLNVLSISFMYSKSYNEYFELNILNAI